MNTEGKAILVGKKVVPCTDLETWAKCFQTEDRSIADTRIEGILVSTVFLGLDHGFGGVPLWFETMIFGGERDQECYRYENYEAAWLGHHDVVLSLSQGQNVDVPWDPI
jgi:hypothetical protein